MARLTPARPTTCAHCGKEAAGYAMAGCGRLCHTGTLPPDDPDAPDCYRLVTVYHRPVGELKEAS